MCDIELEPTYRISRLYNSNGQQQQVQGRLTTVIFRSFMILGVNTGSTEKSGTIMCTIFFSEFSYLVLCLSKLPCFALLVSLVYISMTDKIPLHIEYYFSMEITL